jgi:hypothetical protein
MSDSREMPKYQSHKQVWALKIKSIVRDGEGENRESDGSAIITPEEEGYAPFRVEGEYLHKHKPQIGGYYVVYKDGYKSFSPAEAFEEGNKLIDGSVTFGEATDAAKSGKRVARKGWNGQGMFAYIVPSASYPAQTGVAKEHFGENALVPYRAYWALKTAQEDVATWSPSGSDSLAEDWVILD